MYPVWQDRIRFCRKFIVMFLPNATRRNGLTERYIIISSMIVRWLPQLIQKRYIEYEEIIWSGLIFDLCVRENLYQKIMLAKIKWWVINGIRVTLDILSSMSFTHSSLRVLRSRCSWGYLSNWYRTVGVKIFVILFEGNKFFFKTAEKILFIFVSSGFSGGYLHVTIGDTEYRKRHSIRVTAFKFIPFFLIEMYWFISRGIRLWKYAHNFSHSTKKRI